MEHKRILYFDIIRCIAIVIVVFGHAHELMGIWQYADNPKDLLLVTIFEPTERVSVTMFLMLTGALMLKRYISSDFHFPIKRIIQFMGLLVFYSILTNAIFLYCDGYSTVESLYIALKKYNALSGDWGEARHLWYMPMIISIYLLLPFMAKLIKSLSVKEMYAYVGISMILFLVPWLFNYNDPGRSIVGRLHHDGFGIYISYVIMGYALANGYIYGDFLKKILLNTRKCVIVFFISTTIPLIFEYYKGEYNILAFNWYDTSIFMFIASICVFMIFKNIFSEYKTIKFSSIITSISKMSFGMYLSHYAILCMMKYFMLSEFAFRRSINICIMFVMTFILSYLLSYICSKNKYLKYLVA